MMKKIFSLLLLFFTLILISGCSKEEIKLNIIGDSEIEVGCSILLKAEYNGEGTLTWDSSNPSIAEVYEGMVIAYKEGEVLISVTDGSLTAEKEIKITPNIIEITIEGKNTLVIGEKYEYKALLSKDVDSKVIWESTDDSILSIDENGNATAIAPGKAIISASLLGNTSEFSVEVVNDELPTEPIVPTTPQDPTDPNDIVITGQNTVKVDESIFLQCNYECLWTSSNDDIAFVTEEGEVIGTGEGTAIIYATDINDSINVAEFVVTVLGKAPSRISIIGKNKVAINKAISLEVEVYPNNSSKLLIFKSSDESIASVSSNGEIIGVSTGTVVISVHSAIDETVFSTFEVEVVLGAPQSITISGDKEMIQGNHNYLEASVVGEKVSKELIWKSSNPAIAIVYQGIVLAVNQGNVTISAHSAIDEEVYASIDIKVNKYIALEESKEDLERVEEILSKMTLEQKVGQMFVIGFNGTNYSDSFGDVIEDYNFGNVIYMGYNVTSPSTLANLTNNIQSKMIEENGVPAFISIDQEGGRVARLTNGGTHFISSMAMAATNDINNTYLEGVAMGAELRNYGINTNFAPVLDVNNNAENPIIGIRSYSDNPVLVSLYGNNMFIGLGESNVMACSKHFPGHGNTAVDSHFGLPTITSSIDELYQTELAPFISAVANGIDSIMTTHIIFSAIDTKYPATLSEKVLTDLLRNEIGFEGLIITDGMEMDAVSKNFGGYDTTGVLAVKAGVDILTYTTSSNPKAAYDAIIKEVKNGGITEERINESVRRILLKKLKYGILDGYYAENKDITEMLSENKDLNIKFAIDSLTLVKGDFNGFDKSKSLLIISPTTVLTNTDGDTCATYMERYLKEQGFVKVKSASVSNNISNSDSNTLAELAKEYDQIVIAMSNVKTSNYTRTVSFVNKVAALDKELLVVAVDTPYDLMSYTGVENYVCLYGLQKETVIALSKFVNGEFEAKGKLPISEELFA